MVMVDFEDCGFFATELMIVVMEGCKTVDQLPIVLQSSSEGDGCEFNSGILRNILLRTHDKIRALQILLFTHFNHDT